MKIIDEKTFKYYKENPNYIKYKIKEIKDALKQCEYLINNPNDIYKMSKLEDLEQVLEYKDFLLFELDVFKLMKRKLEKGSF